MTSLVLLAARLPCGKVVGRRLDRLSVNQLALADNDDILGTCETGRHFDPDPVVDIRRDTDLVSHTLVDHEDRFGRIVRDQRRRRDSTTSTNIPDTKASPGLGISISTSMVRVLGSSDIVERVTVVSIFFATGSLRTIVADVPFFTKGASS